MGRGTALRHVFHQGRASGDGRTDSGLKLNARKSRANRRRFSWAPEASPVESWTGRRRRSLRHLRTNTYRPSRGFLERGIHPGQVRTCRRLVDGRGNRSPRHRGRESIDASEAHVPGDTSTENASSAPLSGQDRRVRRAIRQCPAACSLRAGLRNGHRLWTSWDERRNPAPGSPHTKGVNCPNTPEV